MHEQTETVDNKVQFNDSELWDVIWYGLGYFFYGEVNAKLDEAFWDQVNHGLYVEIREFQDVHY